MLRSSNPILSKQDAFTPAAPQYGQAQFGQNQYGQAQFGQAPYGQQPYGQPGQTSYGHGPAGYGQAPPPQQTDQGRMTFDDVVTKTAVTIGILVVTAALSFVGMASGFIPGAAFLPMLIGSGLIGFITVMLVSFRRQISPALVLAYAAVEGVFIGMISLYFEMIYDGIVASAVLATFIAAGVTLAAYKFFNIRVTPKFQKVVVIATIAFAVAILANFLLSLVGINLGLRDGGTGPVSLIAVGVSLLGAVLAVLNLVLDFDYIEKGVAMGAPAKESWRGAFGLTVTMVWLYIEILRLLSYLRR